MEKRILLGREGAANERKYGPSLNKYFKIGPTIFFNLLCFGQHYVMFNNPIQICSVCLRHFEVNKGNGT